MQQKYKPQDFTAEERYGFDMWVGVEQDPHYPLKADIAAANLKTRPAAPQPPPAPGSRSGASNAPTGSLDAPPGVARGGREGAK